MENGAKLAWLVDPVDGNVTVYSQDGDIKRLDRPDVVRGSGPVAGFELACRPLWLAR